MKENYHLSVAPQHSGQKHARPLLMHPLVFISAWFCLGNLFALQEWVNLRHWGYMIGIGIELKSWGAEFLIWGVLNWLLWRIFGPFIQRAGFIAVLTRVLPLGLGVCAVKEMIWVLFFPNLPLNHSHMPYWTRLQFHLNADALDDMVIFWCGFLLIRGVGYFQRSRDSESIATQLEVQLANARLSALRMQLNPHFLFNAMNSISSLMRSDVDAADEMLEQLSSLLRITLERGSIQLIPLRDEIEFAEVFLSMQDRRYSDRVRRTMSVDPSLHDALVPAMFLQPIVENAYVHGLSKIDRNGELKIDVNRALDQMEINVVNSGVGLPGETERPTGHGVGISNLRSRLQLQYGGDCSVEIRELDSTHVGVKVSFPIQMSNALVAPIERSGAA